MDKVISFERVKKIALENIGLIQHHICKAPQASLAAVQHYLETGEALRTRKMDCPNVISKLTGMLDEFIRGLDVRCVGELLEMIPKGLDNRLPRWLYGPVEAQLGEEGWELVPAA
jgi:hypothetical protein